MDSTSQKRFNLGRLFGGRVELADDGPDGLHDRRLYLIGFSLTRGWLKSWTAFPPLGLKPGGIHGLKP